MRMSTPVHYSTFEAFRPHFDALQRVGYFKIVLKKLTRRKYVFHYVYMTVAFVFIMLYNLQHFIQVVQVKLCFRPVFTSINSCYIFTSLKYTGQVTLVTYKMG